MFNAKGNLTHVADGKKDEDDNDTQAIGDGIGDASSVGKGGAPTVDTSAVGGRGDDSFLDAALSNADYVHPTIRRTEVVLQEKADQKQADIERKAEDFLRNTQTGASKPGSAEGDGEKPKSNWLAQIRKE